MPRWKRTASVGCLILLLSAALAGCWDRLEIEDRAVILGLGVDSLPEREPEHRITHQQGAFGHPEKNRVRVTAQIAVPGRIPLGPQAGGGVGGGAKKPVWVVSGEGFTIDGAITNLQQQVADRLFYGHLRVIVISEDLARKSVANLNDYFRRNPEIRRMAWMIVCRGEAEKMMKISPELERVPALYLLATMDHAVEMGKFPNDFLGMFWSTLSAKGQDPYLPYLTNNKGNNVEVSGVAYFNGERMVGVSDPLDIAYLMELKGFQRGGYSAYAKVPGRDGYVMFHATRRGTKIQSQIRGGRPYFKVMIQVEGNIEEKSNDDFVVKEREIQAIESQLEDNLLAGLQDFVARTQKTGSDIFGFGEYVRAKHWRFWNRYVATDKAWSDLYKEAKIEFKVGIKVRRVGMKAR